MHRTEILLLRHGTSVWNTKNIHQGQHLKEPGLDELGRRQARRTAEFLQDEPILAFWSSPLPRARQSAIILYKTYHQNRHASGYIPPIHHYGLMEISHGIADGMHFEKIRELYPEEYDKMVRRIWDEALFPGGEIPLEAAYRAYRTHQSIAHTAAIIKKNSGNCEAKIVIVSHGAINCFFLCQITGTPLDQGWDKFPQDNLCINRIIWDTKEKTFEVLSVNETKHLGELHVKHKGEA